MEDGGDSNQIEGIMCYYYVVKLLLGTLLVYLVQLFRLSDVHDAARVGLVGLHHA